MNERQLEWTIWGWPWPISLYPLTAGAPGRHTGAMWPFSLVGWGISTQPQKGQSESQLGLLGERVMTDRQTDWLTPSMAGAVTKLGDEGSHFGCHVDKAAFDELGDNHGQGNPKSTMSCKWCTMQKMGPTSRNCYQRASAIQSILDYTTYILTATYEINTWCCFVGEDTALWKDEVNCHGHTGIRSGSGLIDARGCSLNHNDTIYHFPN